MCYCRHISFDCFGNLAFVSQYYGFTYEYYGLRTDDEFKTSHMPLWEKLSRRVVFENPSETIHKRIVLNA